MFRDFLESFRKNEYWTYSTWLKFGLKYRKTSLGPLWLLVSPALFVAFLGYLFSSVNGRPLDVFMPHLAVGFITWTLISGIINTSAVIFQARRSEILQGEMRLTDLVLAETFSGFLHYLHQLVIIVVVFVLFKIVPDLYSLVSLVGVALILLNSLWITLALGILGARYRDLVEMISAVMRLAFFITPIIWIPVDGAGGVLGAFLVFNPFYHFLDLVRAPLLGAQVAPISWIVVLTITVTGLLVTQLLYKRSSRLVPLWV